MPLKTKFTKLFFPITFCLLIASNSMAIHTFPDTTYINENNNFNINIALNSGLIFGQMDEFVFSGSQKVSELNWELMPVYYLGGNIKINYKKIFFSFGYWSGLNKDSGYIEDSDWNEITGEYTNYSQHTCKIDSANFIDLNVYYLIMKKDYIELTLLIGFNYKRLRLRAVDGYLQYPPGSAKVDFYGTGIAYEQEHIIPYFGTGISFLFLKDFDIGLYFYYSPFSVCNAHDSHFATVPKVDFYDTINFGNYISTGLNLGYKLNMSLSINLHFQYMKLFMTKGDSYNIDSSGNKSVTFNNSAGSGHEIFNISFGFQYNVFMM